MSKFQRWFDVEFSMHTQQAQLKNRRWYFWNFDVNSNICVDFPKHWNFGVESTLKIQSLGLFIDGLFWDVVVVVGFCFCFYVFQTHTNKLMWKDRQVFDIFNAFQPTINKCQNFIVMWHRNFNSFSTSFQRQIKTIEILMSKKHWNFDVESMLKILSFIYRCCFFDLFPTHINKLMLKDERASDIFNAFQL